jgi:hypothetical protein
MKLQLSALVLAAALVVAPVWGPAFAQDAAPPTEPPAPAEAVAPAAPAPAEPAAAAPAPDVVAGLVKAPPAGKGQVVFFRKNSIFGAAISYKVRTGPNLESVMGVMSNGVYFVVVADPGTHVFSGATEAKDAITVEIEDGETTFVEGALAVGVLAGRPDLKPSDQAAFEKAVKGGTKKAKKAK